MRKIIKIFVFFFIMINIFIISSCGDFHLHLYSNVWKYDDTYHWRECTFDNCNSVIDKETHSFSWVIDETKTTKHQECSKCGYAYDSVGIEKLTPSFTIPTGITATYGDTLSDVILPEGFKFEDDLSTPVGEPGLNNFFVSYTKPNDEEHLYNVVNGIQISILVNKKASSITNVSDISKVFDGSPVSTPTFDKIGDGEVTITWYFGNVKLSSAPTLIGQYKVIISIAESKCYTSTSVEKVFFINASESTFNVVVTKSGNGSTTPNGTTNIALNDSLECNFIADDGYYISSLKINDIEYFNEIDNPKNNYSLTLNNISQNVFIDVVFTLNPKLTFIVNGFGTTPEDTYVLYGSDYSTALTAVDNYYLKKIYVNDIEYLISDNILKIDNITDDMNIVIIYSINDEYIINCSGDYGYNTLSSSEKLFYDKLDEVISSFHTTGIPNKETINGEEVYYLNGIEYQTYDVDFNRAYTIFRIYCAEHPLYYWIGQSILSDSKKIYPVVGNEFYLQSSRDKTNELLYEKINLVRSEVDQTENDYQIALGYHDKIINMIDYAYDNNGLPQEGLWAHTILGVFMVGTNNIDGAVCEGYAKAFQLLLYTSGIDNILVTGVGHSSGYEGHAWNLVSIDNEYYWYDVTWDDQPTNPGGKTYNYFCKSNSDTNFTSTHIANVKYENSSLYENVLYNLPTDLIADTSYSKDDTIYKEISIGNFNYVISGYKEVQLIECKALGEVTILESISYLNENYNVTTIGAVYGDNNTLATVFSKGVTSINLPKTISFIWDVSFRVTTIRSINVSEDNPKFMSEDGVLYTKNKFTLIVYPSAKTGSSYALDSSTYVIALYAFYNCSLSKLSVSSNLKEYYLPNFGLGYYDSLEKLTKDESRIATLSQQLKNNGTNNRLTIEEFKTVTSINQISIV